MDEAPAARYFAQLVDYVEASGIPCRDALSAAQIRTLNDPQARLTMAQVDALLRELVRLTARTDLAFELGKLIKLNSHDVLGYALISCPTVDHVLRLVARYYRIISPMFTFRYERHGDTADIAMVPVLGMSEHTLHFHIEAAAVSFHQQIESVIQGKVSGDYVLSMPAPAHAARYRELLPARFQFGPESLPGVRIRLVTDSFDAPLAMTDLRALDQAEARCKQLMQECSVGGKWGDWVRMLLMKAEDCQPTLDELASIVNLSARTLDRYLAREGTNLRALKLEVRDERAREMLGEGRLAISQIAYRLGYTDIANFSRAFKRENGVSPSAFVDQLRGAK
ncbi:MAG: AraC family transcriptional regulator ligand-binding domain-containing protein [Pseudomonadota bacterium]